MRSPKCVLVSLLLAVFALPCLADGPAAVENPTFPIEPVKMGAEMMIKKLAEMGYNTNCRAKNLDYASDDSWYCGLFAAISGAKEAEWKDRLMDRLSKIAIRIQKIEMAVEQIQAQQTALVNQNKQILTRLNEVGPESIIGKSITHIRLDWNDQYIPLFTGKRPMTPERTIAFARQIIFNDELHKELGTINDQLTQNNFGNDTLLLSYGRRTLQTGTTNLDVPYEYIQSVLQGLILEERRGFVMYVWAAETLEANCEMKGDCDDFHKLPHTANEFREIFARYLDQQLAEFNSAIEFTVLARSDPHHRSAYILPEHGLRVLARADFFTSAMLDQFGLRGRVISMGDGFDGKLTFNGNRTIAPTAMMTSPPTYENRVDYWRATTTPNVYDEIRLADRWKIYHYYDGTHLSSPHIVTALPYKPQKIEMRTVKLDDGRDVSIGSFTAIERAGGGYALLSGTGYEHARSAPGETINGSLLHKRDKEFFDDAAPYAGFEYGGQLEWEVFRGVKGEDQHIEAKRTGYSISRKTIRYPDGGELTLGVDLADPHSIICPGGACSDFSPFVILYRQSQFKKGGVKSRDAKMNTRAAVVLGDDGSSSNGIVWQRDSFFSSPIDERVDIRKDSGRVTLDANKPYKLIFGGETNLDIQTSGTNATPFETAVIIKLGNAYLGE